MLAFVAIGNQVVTIGVGPMLREPVHLGNNLRV